MVHYTLAQRQDNNFGTGGGNDNTDISTGDESTDLFLSLIADPFQSEIQSTSFYAALIWAFGVGALFFLIFCLLRPRVSYIYAPRAKHADAKHAPPPIGPGFFGWWVSLKAVKEQELVEKIGLDATIFLRFLKMTRNIFFVLSVVGCAVLIPVNLVGTRSSLAGNASYGDIYLFVRITPQFIYGNKFWAFVVLAYIFNGVIFFFLWRNYAVITNLRRTYFESFDYQNSLHSRTLLITHIPAALRTEAGIAKLLEEKRPIYDQPNTSVARNVKGLPELIEDHEKAVRRLESILAKYFANPDQLPSQRPTCKPFKNDHVHKHGQKIDAINYLTTRITQLEDEINRERQSVDNRNPLPYGFASFTRIEEAHAVAYAVRDQNVQGTTIKLAPRPLDLIWRNLPMSRKARRTQSAWNGLWVILLTIMFIPPNVLTAVFLANLHNLGQVWQGFNQELLAHPTGWAIAQGILAPGIQILFYLFLPSIFRKLLVRSGDITKNSRERHVMSKLYAFFIFNKLFVFSVFAAAWAFVATVINAQEQSVWDAIQEGELVSKVVIGLCNISPYWITFQLQNNLGAAVDILQAWPLIRNSFRRKFGTPTPRELVETTAPQPFEYATYYSNYLFIVAVGLTFGTIQPLILPVTAFYVTIEAWFKKYMLQYIFITRIESGGAFWRTVFNRSLFSVLLMDAVIALVVGAKGFANPMLFAMLPLLPLLAAFKWFCSRTFDTQFAFIAIESVGEQESGSTTRPSNTERIPRKARDRVAVKYGHPALYKSLLTPMVHAKSQHLLKQIYHGRMDDHQMKMNGASRPNSVFGYSDIYMSEMDPTNLGKPTSNTPFEVVSESDLDFENFKRRDDFAQDFGGDGELYGHAEDQISRPNTPSSMLSFGGSSTLLGSRRPGERSRSESPAYDRRNMPGEGSETTYSRGYANIPFRNENEAFAQHSSPTGKLYQGSSDSGHFRSGHHEIGMPTQGLETRMTDLDIEPYLDHEVNSYQERRLSSGSLGGMLADAQSMGRSPSPRRVQRKPVASPPNSGRTSRASPLGFMPQSTTNQYDSTQGSNDHLIGHDDNYVDYEQYRRSRP